VRSDLPGRRLEHGRTHVPHLADRHAVAHAHTLQRCLHLTRLRIVRRTRPQRWLSFLRKRQERRHRHRGHHFQRKRVSPAATSPSSRSSESTSAAASSATTGHTGDLPAASTAAGSQRTMLWPRVTVSPLLTSSSKPSPFNCTVSMPRWVRTPCPPPSTTTKACGCSETMTPSTGETAVEGSRTGSIAVPGPTMAPEKTGSGTAASPMARPESGDVTVVMGSLPGGDLEKRGHYLSRTAHCAAGYVIGRTGSGRKIRIRGLDHITLMDLHVVRDPVYSRDSCMGLRDAIVRPARQANQLVRSYSWDPLLRARRRVVKGPEKC